MMEASDKLSKDAHSRILHEKIFADPEFIRATAQERPKAILLGGQSGAGKGGLVKGAKTSLHGDVLTVDPDKLRDYHPDIDKFRTENPYTWSTRTMADAGKWAAELRDAAVAGRKNIIVDGTPRNGEASAKRITTVAWQPQSLAPIRVEEKHER